MTERKKARTMKSSKEIRAMTLKERSESLEKLKEDLMHERGIASMGGAPMSPGKIRQLRKSISRHLTIIGEISRAEAAKANEKKKAPKPKAVKKKAVKKKKEE
jgi:large subunit ribosomal protein L29